MKTTMKEKICVYLKTHPGATDAELTKALDSMAQIIGSTARALQKDGYIKREKNPEKNSRLGNYLTGKTYLTPKQKKNQKSHKEFRWG